MKKDEELTPELRRVAREKGTEAPFTGKYWNNHEQGIYKCAICGTELFSSDTKFDSGTGWPSFTQPVKSPIYYVYVLRISNGQLYVGSTNNLVSRIKKHKNGEVFTTRKYLPVALIYYESYSSEREARHREKMLKYHGSVFAHLKARIIDNREISLAGFTEPANLEHIELKEDLSHGMVRTEVVCKKCGAHLGHVFDDGPRDKGGKRYCINSVCLELEKKDKK